MPNGKFSEEFKYFIRFYLACCTCAEKYKKMKKKSQKNRLEPFIGSNPVVNKKYTIFLYDYPKV